MFVIITNTAAVVLVMNDEYWLPYALEASRGFFDRYVIYDVGSTDNTPNIIDWFVETQKAASQFYVRKLPLVPPAAQGCFRNSMIAEGLSDYYFILDGDEVYNPSSYNLINNHLMLSIKIYGVVSRREITSDLKSIYPRKNHHRLYAKEAIWKGPHPGEAPVIEQKPSTEAYSPDIICYHFHNAERSSRSKDVPKREERLMKPTYRPQGELMPINLLEELPLLQKPINGFAVAPALAKLQDAN